MSDCELSSDDSCDGILKKALDVELPDDFDPNSIPQTGEEYLHHVIYERNNCKTWIKATIDPSKLKKQQPFQFHVEEGSVYKSPKQFLPSNDWQTKKVTDFQEFRKFVEQQTPLEGRITTFEEETFLDKVKSGPPSFSEMTKFAQCSKIRKLQIISKYFDSIAPGESIDENMGSWIYAILALLDLPLSPSSCHTLRELGKRCHKVRSKLIYDCDESLYIPLNLYICIVGRFFRQHDLADP